MASNETQTRGILTAIRSKLGRPPGGPQDARRRWSALRRRAWLVLQAIVLVPAVAVAYSASRDPVYRGTALIQLRTTTLAAANVEARSAKEPAFLGAVVSGQPQDITAADFAKHASVGIVRTNVLAFSVESDNAGDARSLATLWAFRFSVRRRVEFRTSLRARVQQLRGAPPTATVRAQLATARRLLADPTTTAAAVVGAANKAEQVTPRPLRAALMGLAFGLVLGIVLAFAAEAATRRRAIGEPGSG